MAWVLLALTLALHVLVHAKVGGVPLLLSMWSWRFRNHDSPLLWPKHVARWWSWVRQQGGIGWWRLVTSMSRLEMGIWITMAAAWIIPLLRG